MKDKNARLTFTKHEELQLMSPGKVYDTCEYMTILCDLSIKDYTTRGMRVSFIKDWFEQLRLLNEFAVPGKESHNGDDHLLDELK